MKTTIEVNQYQAGYIVVQCATYGMTVTAIKADNRIRLKIRHKNYQKALISRLTKHDLPL